MNSVSCMVMTIIRQYVLDYCCIFDKDMFIDLWFLLAACCFLFCFSFSLLWGPVNHVKHLCSLERLPFTAAYFGSMFATLYMAMIVSIVTC